MRVILFAGPTISAHDVRAILDADCRGPVAQGQVYRAAQEHPEAIGIIDGYFELQPSVWHKEILWAMSQGIHVFGSASMGAMRAAELAPFGMTGVGKIFDAFLSGDLEDDDEVAVAHAGPDCGYRPGSDAMVNIRATLQKAAREGVIESSLAAEATAYAKSQFYAARSYAAILDHLPDLEPLRCWLPTSAVNQKKEDALAMVRQMRSFLGSNPGPKQVDFVFQESLWWDVLCQREGAGTATITDAEVLAELDRSQDARRRALTGALGWWLADREARRDGAATLAADVVAATAEFCSAHQITDEVSLQLWLHENLFQRPELNRMLQSAALADRSKRSAGAELRTCLLRYLRWTGEYPDLRKRALRHRGDPSDPR